MTNNNLCSKEVIEIENQNKKNEETNNYKQIIEACLFAAGHPVSYSKFAETLNIPVSEVTAIINEYSDEYNSTSLPRGILFVKYNNSCQLCTKNDMYEYVKTILGIKKGGNLSDSSIEVLSIIAYNEPVTKAFVDTVRGVDSSYTISTLCDKDLIKQCGKLDAPGKPNLYKTTTSFLRVFGIESINDLPDSGTKKIESMEQLELTTDN